MPPELGYRLSKFFAEVSGRCGRSDLQSLHGTEINITPSSNGTATTQDQLFLVGIGFPVRAGAASSVMQEVGELNFSAANDDLNPTELAEIFGYEVKEEGPTLEFLDLTWRSIPGKTAREAINRVLELLEQVLDPSAYMMLRVQHDPSDAPAAAMTKIWPELSSSS